MRCAETSLELDSLQVVDVRSILDGASVEQVLGEPREPSSHHRPRQRELRHLLLTDRPEVLRERIMNPIGASDRWEWHGYRNSVATLC